jgi:hypothetical protein
MFEKIWHLPSISSHTPSQLFNSSHAPSDDLWNLGEIIHNQIHLSPPIDLSLTFITTFAN